MGFFSRAASKAAKKAIRQAIKPKPGSKPTKHAEPQPKLVLRVGSEGLKIEIPEQEVRPTPAQPKKTIELPKGITEAKCPYCNVDLDKIPQRKTKCPHCGQFMFVRDKMVFTDNGIEEYEKAAEALYEAEWAERSKRINAVTVLENMNIPESMFEQREKEFTSKLGGKPPKPSDVAMSLFNENLLKQMKKGAGPSELSGLYYDMARYLHEGNLPFFHLLQQALKLDLQSYRGQEFVDSVVILNATGCPGCKKLDNKIFPIKEALKTMPIPVKECTSNQNQNGEGFCMCTYSPHVKDI